MAMSIWDELEQGVMTDSAESTRDFGRRLGTELPAEATLALHGDLGVGKTTFVQGLATAFGIHEQVTSPTFTIYHVHRGHRTLVHLDAFRLTTAAEVEALLLDDFLVPPFCLAIEWPERIAAWLPRDRIALRLGIESPGRHRIQRLH
jgi:tRNA threonylcarbamoyladenosine biosynthesis protein TsaE